MKFLSLFSGIGGFDLGLERAGMECVGQVEKDPYCLKILAKHWPDVKRIEDIHNARGDEFGTVDLVCGGFPCQPFSCAGKRDGTKDDRHLWPEMFRVIQTVGPPWVIGENVRGILTIEQGMVFESVLSDLESIGYEVQPFIIPACSVNAPHRRDRVWIIANLPGWENERRERGELESSTTGRESGNATTCACSEDADVTNAPSGGLGELRRTPGSNGQPDGIRTDVTDPDSSGLRERRGGEPNEQEHGTTEYACENAADTESQPEREPADETVPVATCRETRAEPESRFRGGHDGLPFVLDGIAPTVTGCKNRNARLKALGNAVVPQIVEEIGRAIMETDRAGGTPCS